eukprot:TRINITY_DN1782_c0_g3_i2.p1 TRINITY_DN1782_c0_g3~~TRINITY_DN1782_c0_g3_i2.p1  ORF type:complete len:176 (+),score=34.04 TRINITY_DN1782_c0_g3_i2:57-584(+)
MRFFAFFALFLALVIAKPTTGTCTFCEYVIQIAETYIENNATEQEVIDLFSKACSVLPSPYNTLCQQEVDQWGPVIIQWIINKEDPQAICSQLHLCTVTRLARRTVQQSSCDICQLVVSYADNFLQSNGTEAGLEKALDSLCSLLPPRHYTVDPPKRTTTAVLHTSRSLFLASEV